MLDTFFFRFRPHETWSCGPKKKAYARCRKYISRWLHMRNYNLRPAQVSKYLNSNWSRSFSIDLPNFGVQRQSLCNLSIASYIPIGSELRLFHLNLFYWPTLEVQSYHKFGLTFLPSLFKILGIVEKICNSVAKIPLILSLFLFIKGINCFEFDKGNWGIVRHFFLNRYLSQKSKFLQILKLYVLLGRKT